MLGLERDVLEPIFEITGCDLIVYLKHGLEGRANSADDFICQWALVVYCCGFELR